jgi:hypothetical protein
MRTLIGLVAALIFAGLPFAASAAVYSGSAPADEYFGPHKQSILEIRNRLDRLEQKAPRELIASNSVVELDDLAASISDWHAQYPNDPWLPRSYARLLRTYSRAGFSTSDQAVASLNEMQDAYPDAPETSDIAMLYGVDQQETDVASAPVPVQSMPQAPMPVAVPVLAVAQPVFLADAWVRFGSMRGANAYAPAQVLVPVAAPAPAHNSTTVTVTVTTTKGGP